MKAIITQYATTTGVQIKEGERGVFRTFLCEDGSRFASKAYCLDGVSAHNDVVRRFMKKRESLKKQLAKLDDKLANALTAIKESGL